MSNLDNLKHAVLKFLDNTHMRFEAFEDAPQIYDNLKHIDEAHKALQLSYNKLLDENVKLKTDNASWKGKFDAMWSAWRKLAEETKGKEEADKMAELLKHTNNQK